MGVQAFTSRRAVCCSNYFKFYSHDSLSPWLWRQLGFQNWVLSLFQVLFRASELAFPKTAFPSWNWWVLLFRLKLWLLCYLDWRPLAGNLKSWSWIWWLSLLFCLRCAVWIGSHWLATWSLDLEFDGYCWQFAAVLPQVFTFSLRNDAHSYISDNVMGTQCDLK